MRAVSIILFAIWLTTVTALASSPATPAGQEPELRYGTDTASAPFSFRDAKDVSKVIGLDVDVIEAVAKQMHYKPVLVDNKWDNLVPGLQRGIYDAAVDGIEVTGEHASVIGFSTPYFITDLQLVVLRENNTIKSLSDCRHKKVGTITQSQALRVLRDAGDIDIKIYEQEPSAYNDLITKRVDAVLLDTPIALYYAKHNPRLKFTGTGIGRVECGIALRKDSYELREKINQALQTIKTNGQLRAILEKWNLWNPQMADYLSSHHPTLTAPTGYNEYVEKVSTTLSARISLYKHFIPMLLRATFITLEVSILAMLLAIALGFTLAIIRIYGPHWLALICTVYIEIIRGTPLLIQLFFIFYGLPYLGIKFPPLLAGILGLGLNYAAYEAENYRAGLLSVHHGQIEAAAALAMTRWQSLRYIVAPQAMRLVLPPVTNDFISLLKDSSLVSMITIVELTGAYSQLATTYYDYFGIGIIIAAIYLLIGLPFVRLARWTEKRLAVDKRKYLGNSASPFKKGV